MPARRPDSTRKRRPAIAENSRERIKATLLIKRLIAHALSDDEIMTATQIKAAEILLKKVLPDLQATSLTGADGAALIVRLDKADGKV